MLLLLLIGWIVLLPAIVVAGLYIGSTVLGRRRAPMHHYADLFSDEQILDDADLSAVTPEAITGRAASATDRLMLASPNAPASDARRVGAGY